MEAAGKVQSMASVKVRMTERPASQDVSVQAADFTKLLQAKQEQTNDAKPASGEAAGSDKTVKKPETEPAKDTKDDAEGQVEETGDSGQQEALEKAALQLAAAQMVVVVPEKQTEAVAEMPVEAVEAETGVAALAGGTPAMQEQAAKQPGMAEELFREDVTVPAEEKAEPPIQESKTEENPEGFRIAEPVREEPKAEVKPDTRRQESREDFRGTEAKPVQESDGSAQQTAGAGEFRVSGQTEPVFRETGRMENLPLKTTPENLPQDLGKTLAARLPEAGRTLTVELEPASLGKLTIRMTYEAGRAAVSILATNPRTLEILSEKAAEIASILEEKTGQETVILTQKPQEQEEYQENKHGGNAREDQEQREQGKDEHHSRSDSFAQQLRLGLV